jgi:hypothetical protein
LKEEEEEEEEEEAKLNPPRWPVQSQGCQITAT